MSKISELYNKNKKIIENVSYLSILQGLNMLIPLLVFPYLIHVLGSEIYGLIIFSQAIIGYFVIFINFGFNITATKEISIHRENKHKVNKILSCVLIIKGGLLFISFVILTFLIMLIPELRENKILFYLTLWMCIYELVFPIYYFQGIEEMKYITLITLISRVLFFGLIFYFVKYSGDYLLVPVINGIGAIIAGFISQYVMYKKGVKYSWQPLYMIRFYVLKSLVMALAYASNTLKSNLNIVIIKVFFSYKEVAYFDLAFKISQIGSSFLELISVAVFPKMSREKSLLFLKKIILFCFSLSVLFVFCIQIFATVLVEFLGGTDMMETVTLLRIVVFFVPFYILGGLLGRNSLIVNGYDRDVLYSMALSSLVYISAIFIFYISLGTVSLLQLGYIFVFSFFTDTLYRYIKCKKYKIV